MADLVTRTLVADHVTPVRAYAALRAQSHGRSSFLFESVVPGERWGRYSILGYRAATEGIYPGGGDALKLLDADVAELPEAEGLAARFSKAMVGYIAYDAVHPLHDIEPWATQGELSRMMREATVIVFDHMKQTLTIAARSKNAVDRCAWEMVHGPELSPIPVPDPTAAPASVDAHPEDLAFSAKAARAREYVRSGEAKQVVLARTFVSPLRDADPFDVYRALRVLAPSSYLYFLDFAESNLAPGLQIAGASPETMVRFDDGRVTLRPLARSRPRGVDAADDARLEAELLADPTARAEHEALVELARDEAGRVCEPGSVELAGPVRIERHAQAMHAVSEVSGRARGDVRAGDVVRAAFPAGALTGSPKVRAAQIIRELEHGPRGIYGGAIGYFLPGGSFDLAIAVRTVVCRYGQFEVTAGAAVAPGAAAEHEAEETRARAQAPLAAIRAAHDAAVAREEAEAVRRARLEAKEKAEAEAKAKGDET